MPTTITTLHERAEFPAAVGEFQSFIRTGGEWIEKSSRGWNGEPDGERIYVEEEGEWVRVQGPPLPYRHHGAYVGGTREAGRFTSKLAPASSCPLATSLARDRETVSIPAAPRYDTPSEVTRRAQERGTGAYLPAKGEQLGRKFLEALRATGAGWERPSGLSSVETPWGSKEWKTRTAPVVAPARKVARRRKVAA